jgi:hypothetical protein
MTSSVPRYLRNPKSIVRTALLKQSENDAPEVQWICFLDARHPDVGKRNKSKKLYSREPQPRGNLDLDNDTPEDIVNGKIRAVLALLVGEAVIEEETSKDCPLLATVDILCSTLLAEIKPLQAYNESLAPYKSCGGISLQDDTLKFVQKGSHLLRDWLSRSSLGSAADRANLRFMSGRTSPIPVNPPGGITTLHNQPSQDSRSPSPKLRLINKDQLRSDEASSKTGAPELGHRKRGRPASRTFVTNDSDGHPQKKRDVILSMRSSSSSVFKLSSPVPKSTPGITSKPRLKELPLGPTSDETSNPRPLLAGPRRSESDPERLHLDLEDPSYAVGTLPQSIF